MIFGEKKETKTAKDIKERKMLAELLDFRAISLDVKVTPDGVVVECRSNEIAKRLLLNIYGISEEDFESLADIARKTGQEINTALEKYIDESKKKDKGDCTNCFCFIVKTTTGEWEHISPVNER